LLELTLIIARSLYARRSVMYQRYA